MTLFIYAMICGIVFLVLAVIWQHQDPLNRAVRIIFMLLTFFSMWAMVEADRLGPPPVISQDRK